MILVFKLFDQESVINANIDNAVPRCTFWQNNPTVSRDFALPRNLFYIEESITCLILYPTDGALFLIVVKFSDPGIGFILLLSDKAPSVGYKNKQVGI